MKNNIKLILEQLNNDTISPLEAITKLFERCSEGIDSEASFSNVLPVVSYLYKNLKPTSYNFENDGELQHVIGLSRSILKIIEENSPQVDPSDHIAQLFTPFPRFIIRELATNDSPSPHLTALVNIIEVNWDILKDNTYTYRTLASLCKLVNNDSYVFSQSKKELANILKEILKTIPQ